MAASPLQKILPERQIKESVKLWLAEDIPNFDIGAVAITNDDKEGQLLVKESAVVAGVPFVTEVFTQLNCSVEWKVDEGTKIQTVPSCVAIIRGPVVQILQGERLALNIFSRACGVATLAQKFMEISNTNKWKGSVVGTRKTTPGFRLVEKYAMLVGGAGAHRFDLSSMVLLKDNHIDASIVPDKEKAITQAVNQVRKLAGIHMKIEVESRNEKEALAGAAAGADIIMLDNFNARVACSVAQKIKARYPRVSIEASGNIIETNIASFMSTHIDIISTSRLCHGYSVVDVSMKLQPSTPVPNSILDSVTSSPVVAGVKRPATTPEGKPAAKAVADKNGDSIASEVPEKRQKTEESAEPVKKSAPATPSAEASTPAAGTEASAPVAIKTSPATTPKTPAAPKAAAQTPKSGGTRPSGGNARGNASGAGRGAGNAAANKNQNQNRRTPLASKTTPPGARYQNSGNRQDSGGNRGQLGRQQQQQFRSGQNGRMNDRQQVGRGLMNALPGSAGPLHQQLALQAAASRASGMPVRPGGAMGMMVRPGMATGSPVRGGFSGMSQGRANVSGPNAIPINGPRGYGMSGPPNNARDWSYGY